MNENIINLLVFLLVIVPVATVFILGSRANQHRMREFLTQPFVDLIYIFDISQHMEWKKHYNRPGAGLLDRLAARDLNSPDFEVGDTVKFPIDEHTIGRTTHGNARTYTLGTVVGIDDNTFRVSGRGRISENGVLPEGFPARSRGVIRMNKITHLNKAIGKRRVSHPMQVTLISVEQV